jgi:hypothetical protein
MVGPEERERVLERIREICLGLPETSERLSHGADGWERPAGVRHVGLGRPEAGPPARHPGQLVGHRGWLGVRLDRGLHWDELAGIAEDAYAEIAPRGLVEAARRERE